MEFQRLLPEPGPVALEKLLHSLKPAERAHPHRPHVAVNFVSSADGSCTFQGRSRPLGDDGDHAMFHGLREQFDAVIAGTRTLSTEHYGRLLGSGERRARRLAEGLSAEPLTCIITRSGELPLGIPLFAQPEARIVVLTPHRADPPGGWAAQVEQVVLPEGELTPPRALRLLRERFGVRSLLCEGGPLLFTALLRQEVVDELFLTVAPKLTGGGGGPKLTSGPELAQLRGLEVLWLLERHGALYLRYKLA